MFSATNLLGALIDDNTAAPPQPDADATSGLLESMPSMPGGTTGKVLLGAAGVAAAGGLAYAAYRHFKQPGAEASPGGGLVGAPGPTDPASAWLGSPMGAQPNQAPISSYASNPASWGAPSQAYGGPQQAQASGPAAYGPPSAAGPLQAPIPSGAYPGPGSQVATVPAPTGYGTALPTQPRPDLQAWAQQSHGGAPAASSGYAPGGAPLASPGYAPGGAPATPWAQQMPARPTTVVSPPDVGPFPAAPRAEPTQAGASDPERDALLLVRAMIAAANIDGTIDPAERQVILERVARAGLGAAERAALEHELAQPRVPCVLLAEVRSRELAEQFYVVSLLGVSCDTDAERAYLRGLPYVLGMRPEDVARLHARLGVAAP